MRFLAVFLLALGAPAAAQAPLALNVGGRVVVESGGAMSFGWPGVYFESRFRGTAVRVRFEAPAEHMRLLIDGEERARFERPGAVDLLLDRLPPGEHVVRLEKLTESQTGGGRFFGFYPAAATEGLQPPRRTRQIEFIGDSYTVGYGNGSPTRDCSPRQVHATTDTQQAFGPLVARRFDADYRIHAYSGFGIVRNYAGNVRNLSLPTIYPRLRPDDAAQAETADPRWHPQLIVINLGTNDFSTPLRRGERWPSQEALRTAWRQAYADFVRRLQAQHPRARFILMGSDPFFGELEQVAAILAGQVAALRFGGLDLTGCSWHPSLEDHRRLAARLAAAIEAIPGLWRER